MRKIILLFVAVFICILISTPVVAQVSYRQINYDLSVLNNRITVVNNEIYRMVELDVYSQRDLDAMYKDVNWIYSRTIAINNYLSQYYIDDPNTINLRKTTYTNIAQLRRTFDYYREQLLQKDLSNAAIDLLKSVGELFRDISK